MIKLGSKVKDSITGVTGIAIARTEWLNGCARISIQPQELKDGKPVEVTCVDEPQIEVIEPDNPATKGRRTDTGGPQNDPQPRPSPTRS
jgi:hypothetical protein